MRSTHNNHLSKRKKVQGGRGGCCRVELANSMNPWLSCQDPWNPGGAQCLDHFEDPNWECGGFNGWNDHSMVYYVPGQYFWQYCSVEEGHDMPLAFNTGLPGPMDQYKCETILNSTWETSECPDMYNTSLSQWGGRPFCYDAPTYGACETSDGCITTHKLDCDNCGGSYTTGPPSPNNRYWNCLEPPCNCQSWIEINGPCPEGEHCVCFGGYEHCVSGSWGSKPGMERWPGGHPPVT